MKKYSPDMLKVNVQKQGYKYNILSHSYKEQLENTSFKKYFIRKIER